MLSDASNSPGPGRDLLCSGPSACLLWCVAWFAFAVGFREPPVWRTVLWTTSLTFMSLVCLLNASRCGRVHCRFTGPFLILCAVASLGYGLGLLPTWSVWMKMDWRRNNYWCDCAHLHSRSPSWPLSAKWNRRGLSNDEANPITWLTSVSLARYLLRKRTLQNHIQKPAGMMAFFGITMMPSRMK